jgi:hypothetical protein
MKQWMLAIAVLSVCAFGATAETQPAPTDDPRYVMIDDMILDRDSITRASVDGSLATTIFSVNIRPWPAGILVIDFDASVTAGQRDQFLRACNRWGGRAPGVACQVRTTEPIALSVFNRVLPFVGGQSTVGYSQTRNELSIHPNAWNDTTILHEAGHAFGFMHEHQRHDRDLYVTIDASNVATGYIGNFNILSPSTSQVHGSYDFLSIMHYYPNAFAVDPSRPNIIAKPPYQQYQNLMGRATTLSDRDLGGIVSVYGTAPDPPTAPIATTGSTSVRLSWTPASTGGAPTHYVIRAGRAPGASDLGTFNVGNTTSVAANLPTGVYYIAITAVNERGPSQPTPEISFTLTGAPPAPGAPRLEATAAGNSLSMSWTPASGGEVSSYVVQAGSTSGASDIYSGSVGVSTSLQAVVALRTYFLRVLAQNSVSSVASNEVRVDVTGACTVPAAPTLSLSRVGRLVTANWTQSAGGSITTYVLQAGRSPGGIDLFNAPVGLLLTASGTLAPGTYYVRVFAQSSCGNGPASNEATVVVP